MDKNRYTQRRRQIRHQNTDGFLRSTAARQPQRPNSHLSRSPEPPSKTKPQPDSATAQSPYKYYYSPYTDRRANAPINPVKTKHKWSRKKKVVVSALTILLIGFGVGTYFGSRIIGNIDKVFHGNVFSDAQAIFSTTTLKGEAQGRVNILLAGDSADDPGHAGADLTDSILVLSVDTQNHTAFLLSIPRDLWVYIPSSGSYQKINAANEVSNFSAAGYPSGGMGQLEQIVQTNLGIPIDYFGLIDYTAFQDAVNAVGGVTITINSPDPRGLYDPNANLKLPNGTVTLNGQQALDLARARGDGPGSYGFPDSDFDRTEHQRQLFIAVGEKAKTLGVITNPVKVSNLFSAFGNNVQTDLNLQDVLRLIQLTKNINPSTVQSYTYSSTISSTSPNPILENYTDPASGEEALIPSDGLGDYGQMQQYYQQLTSSNPVVKEAPNVVILNASDVVGLAKKEQTALQAQGFNVASIADANNEHPTTMIVDNSKGTKPNSLALLQKLYPGTTVTSDTGSSEADEAQGYTADFIVILGQNWDTNQ
jgi:polyisoprenyl-teichoic acid--peptidoglycan teichoic acid transferase